MLGWLGTSSADRIAALYRIRVLRKTQQRTMVKGKRRTRLQEDVSCKKYVYPRRLVAHYYSFLYERGGLVHDPLARGSSILLNMVLAA